jgi:hypothetical protein
LVPRFADRWREIVMDLERLHERPGISVGEINEARVSVHELLGETVVIERNDGVYVQVGLRSLAVYKGGAQERT